MTNKKRFKVTTEVPYLDAEMEESILSLYQKDNQDVAFFNLVNDEEIRLSGSPIHYYKFYESGGFDEVYMEAREKPIRYASMLVFGHYDPSVMEENLGNFGIEITNDQLFTFNKSYIERKLGREPIPGDILRPKFQDVRYIIDEVQEDAFDNYGVYHYICTAKILRDSSNIQDDVFDISEKTGADIPEDKEQ